jgi:putative (di)nucleoside polyphosphate hydrolase
MTLEYDEDGHQKFYRKGVGLMLLNKQGQVFIGERFVKPDLPVSFGGSLWQMPQGGIDFGETPRHAAMRELKEEIGTQNVKILAESRRWLTYDFPPELRKTLWGGRFYGQRQKWFLLLFLGDDSEINIHTKHPEFAKWRWEDPEKLPDIIVSFKTDLYHNVLKEFRRFLKSPS